MEIQKEEYEANQGVSLWTGPYKMIIDAVSALKDNTDTTKVSAADKEYFATAFTSLNETYVEGKKNAEDALALVVKRQEGAARAQENLEFNQAITTKNAELTKLRAALATANANKTTKTKARETETDTGKQGDLDLDLLIIESSITDYGTKITEAVQEIADMQAELKTRNEEQALRDAAEAEQKTYQNQVKALQTVKNDVKKLQKE